MSMWAATLVVAVVLACAASVLISGGIRRVKRIHPIPERTVAVDQGEPRMDETPREIEEHIDRTRERLGSHLKELEHKVEAATDWREHFRARPHFFLGAAFVGGAMLATRCARGLQRPSSDDAGIRRFADGPSFYAGAGAGTLEQRQGCSDRRRQHPHQGIHG